jgi:hypothetical protein
MPKIKNPLLLSTEHRGYQKFYEEGTDDEED